MRFVPRAKSGLSNIVSVIFYPKGKPPHGMGLWAFLLSFAAGLTCAPHLELSGYLPGTALLCAPFYLILRKSPAGLPLLLLFFWVLGGALYHLDSTPPNDPSHISNYISEHPLSISGIVCSVASRYDGGSNIDLDTETIETNTRQPIHGRIRLYIDQGDLEVMAGQRIAFRSRLRHPRLYGTPGEFDFPRHLAYQKIFATAFIADSRDLAVFAPTKKTFRAFIETLRSAVGKHIDQTVPPAEAALLRALIIGDKNGLSPEQKNLLAKGGVSHLFAISGLHLGLLAGMLYALTQPLYRQSERLLLRAPPRRVLPILILPLLLAYLMLTGNAISTRRAFSMFLVTVLLFYNSRQPPPLKLLCSCALLFLMAEPLIFFQPAFQLSFTALFGILALSPHWQQRLPQSNRILRYGLQLALTTAAATLATTPWVLMNFHLLAPAGLFTNIFAIPAIGLAAVPLGLSGTLLRPLWPTGSDLLLQGSSAVIRLTMTAVNGFLQIPSLKGHILYLPPTLIAASFLMTAALLLSGVSKFRRQIRGTAVATASLLCLLPTGPTEKLSVTALSVGQGDATLLSLAGDRHILIDGGGTQSNHFDVGERLLAPALGYLGIQTISAIILTHDHPDHHKGLPYILEHFDVLAFYSPIPPDELDARLLDTLQRHRIPIHRVPAGWSQPTLGQDPDLWFFVPNQADSNLNNRSLVVMAQTGRDAVLLTGDLEESGISQLLSTPLSHSINLLKMPHHGSRKSSPDKLLEQLSPTYAFLSLGAGNPHGFPHQNVVHALQRHQVSWWSTDRHGTLRFSSNGQGWQATHWNQRHFR